jgi:hypothetical protein
MASDTRASSAISRAASSWAWNWPSRSGEVAFRHRLFGDLGADVGDDPAHVAAVAVGRDDDAAARVLAADLVRAVAILDRGQA